MTCKNEFLPEVNCEEENTHNIEIMGDSKCPCCGHFTIPNKGDAIAFICPVCMWEIDLFIKDDYEPSDLNHGLSLKEARKSYKEFGAVLANLKRYLKEPKEYE